MDIFMNKPNRILSCINKSSSVLNKNGTIHQNIRNVALSFVSVLLTV